VLTQIQDTLGEHQDAVIAALEIEHSLDAHRDDPPFVQAANSLIESEREKAEAARQSFFKVWDKLDRKKTRRWMKISPKVKAGA
jgi:CHAD domain-containing protein